MEHAPRDARARLVRGDLRRSPPNVPIGPSIVRHRRGALRSVGSTHGSQARAAALPQATARCGAECRAGGRRRADRPRQRPARPTNPPADDDLPPGAGERDRAHACLGAPTCRGSIGGSIDRLDGRPVDRGRRSVDGQTTGDQARAQAEGSRCARGQPRRIGNEAIAQHAQTNEQRVASRGLACTRLDRACESLGAESSPVSARSE
jgi:hypothetical protein